MEGRNGLSRRTLLKAAGGLGAIALLEACAPGSTRTPNASAAGAQGYIPPGVRTPKRGGKLNLAIAGDTSEPVSLDPEIGALPPAQGRFMFPHQFLLLDRAE